MVSVRQLNTFLALKLPSAYLCGVRVKLITEVDCMTSVKYKWINQNPFKSMFWAVQGMAAELSTGTLVVSKIKKANTPMSMLVVSNNATFTKKAKGRINFLCTDGGLVDQAVLLAKTTGEGQTVSLKAEGTDEVGDVVSIFNFEWSIKIKS